MPCTAYKTTNINDYLKTNKTSKSIDAETKFLIIGKNVIAPILALNT